MEKKTELSVRLYDESKVLILDKKLSNTSTTTTNNYISISLNAGESQTIAFSSSKEVTVMSKRSTGISHPITIKFDELDDNSVCDGFFFHTSLNSGISGLYVTNPDPDNDTIITVIVSD